MATLLALESSCDDTGASVIRNHTLLSNITSSQKIHESYGGVVPELASRAHQRNILPIIQKALAEAGVARKQLDAVAYTQGPGLMGALLVSNSFAKGMSLALDIPLITVNHLHGHLLSHLIESPVPGFPFITLLISGGHTQLVYVKDPLTYEVLGATIDDAAGEALDKAAKVLGLPYPGGPLMDRYGAKGNPERFDFPTPDVQGWDFSFSGMKTSFLYFIRDQLQKDSNFINDYLHDICASYQKAVINYLLRQLENVVEAYGIQDVGIAGGVAANSFLRNRAKALAVKKDWNLFIPDLKYCTDNSAMIAKVAHYQYEQGQFSTLESVPYPR